MTSSINKSARLIIAGAMTAIAAAAMSLSASAEPARPDAFIFRFERADLADRQSERQLQQRLHKESGRFCRRAGGNRKSPAMIRGCRRRLALAVRQTIDSAQATDGCLRIRLDYGRRIQPACRPAPARESAIRIADRMSPIKRSR